MNTQILFKKTLKCSSAFFVFLFLLCSSTVNAQSLTVSGAITESEGQTPLPGVNIIEKGTSNGVSSDFDGNYSLEVSNQNAIIVISFIGYETQEIEINGRSAIDIELNSTNEALDEVVIIGYGEIRKRDLTGAVGSMDEEAITERSVTNPMEAIQGVIPGVQITSSTGRLGDGFNITIRGKNSMNEDSQPLYVVDGVPTDGIDFLNPEDISRIDILKDASSTAIYGSRGSNGVVIVTTKSGATAKGGLTVSFDSYYGIKNVTRLPEMMDGEKWWYYHQSAYLATTNGGDVMNTTPEELHSKVVGSSNLELERRALNNEVFDWYDAILETGTQQNNYLSISGRAENGLGYNIGLGVQKETGNIEKEHIDKYTFKTSVNHRINDKFSAGANVTVAMTEQEFGNDKAMRDAFRLSPFMNPYVYGSTTELYNQPGKLRDENGDYLINKTSTWNPLLQIQGTTDELRRWNMIGNVYAQYSPLEWLSFKTTFSTGYDSRRRGTSWGARTEVGSKNGDLPSAELSNYENFNYTWDNQVNVDYTYKEDHSFSFLGLQSIYSSRTEGSSLSAREMPFDTGFYNIGSGAQSTYNLGSYYIKQTLASFALRLNYSYKDKYLVTISNRWDGSSLFSEGNKWGSFPSAAAAWRVSEESFMKNQQVVSNLKVRVSYGFTGNNIIDPYSTINRLDFPTYYDFDETSANGWYPSALANSSLTWEKTREVNVGIDFGFLNNRITGSLDIYDRLSTDLLMRQILPKETGWEYIIANVGSVSNKGVEVGLSATAVKTKLVKWDVAFTYSKNTNSIESIYGQSVNDDVGNNLFIGESIDAQYNYVFDGIWQADERDEAASYGQTEGQAKVKDINGDGVIDPNDDRVILGSSDPKWSGSFITKLTVGQFDLSASVITNQGMFVYSQFHSNFTDTRDRGRQKLNIDWYIPENTAGVPSQFSNSYPQPRNMGTYWRNEGVGYYRDASYTKVKNIAIGYSFDDELLDKMKINNLRIYANVLDPFVFTKYEGYDPEWAGANWNIARVGSVTYQLGLSLKF